MLRIRSYVFGCSLARALGFHIDLDMDDLSESAAHLWALAEQPPTPTSRAEVLAALHHKREGIQSIAAQVLGAWGSRDSVAPLRDWLLECQQRDSGWAVRGVAVRQLAQLVEAADAEWVLDLYLSVPGWIAKHELLPLVAALTPEVARARLVHALRDPDWTNRHAAVKAIGNMAFPDRRHLLLPLIDDPDRNVRKSARFFAQEA
jgi:HEAT repeat protein